MLYVPRVDATTVSIMTPSITTISIAIRKRT
jgi:hypothetical protein